MLCAIDIGGTKIAGALLDSDYRICAEITIPTPTAAGGPAIAAQVISLVNRLTAGSTHPVRAVGISTGGQIDAAGNIVGATAMIPQWAGLPLKPMVTEETGLPTAVLNDGHAAALAESQLGAGQGQPSMLCIVIGTGLGGGLVIGGRIQHGQHGLAGSVGQLKVTRDGTNYVALEMLVSGPALIQAYNERVQRQAQVSQGQEIAERAQGGDPAAQQVIAALGRWLGLGLSHALHSYDTACVVVGGSVAQLGPLLFSSARQSLQVHGHSTVAETPILPAALGPQAGLFGAAIFAQQQESDSRYEQTGSNGPP